MLGRASNYTTASLCFVSCCHDSIAKANMASILLGCLFPLCIQLPILKPFEGGEPSGWISQFYSTYSNCIYCWHLAGRNPFVFHLWIQVVISVWLFDLSSLRYTVLAWYKYRSNFLVRMQHDVCSLSIPYEKTITHDQMTIWCVVNCCTFWLSCHMSHVITHFVVLFSGPHAVFSAGKQIYATIEKRHERRMYSFPPA